MNFREKLKEYSLKAVKIAKKNVDINDLEFDHVCYQTISDKDYEKALKYLKDEIEVISEIPHAGRRITIANLKNSFDIDGVVINRLEISEPKPKRTVRRRNFDHLAFVTKEDFDKYIDELKGKKIKFTEFKQISDHKIAKFIDGGVEIELRNKPMHDKKVEVKEKPESSEDLKEKIKIAEEQKLRALADYQNLQKRVEEEQKLLKNVANSQILGQLLDCLDDFDRALENLPDSQQGGVRMIREKLQRIIDQSGLEETKCRVGDKFDADLFEATGVVTVTQPSQDNTVKQIVHKGYRFTDNGEVVRPVKVIVGKKE